MRMLTSMIIARLAALCLGFRANLRSNDHTGLLADASDDDRGDLEELEELDNTITTIQEAGQEFNSTDLGQGLKEPSTLEKIASASKSQYFGDHVDGLDFEHMWEKLRETVPLTRLQSFQHPDDKISWPVCHPTLVGPRNSEKLAILMHGFLSCPGMWFRVVPLLVDAGFRVMLPTLPGHGRNPRSSKDHGGTIVRPRVMRNGSVRITDVSDSGNKSDAERYWSDYDEDGMFDSETNGASFLETLSGGYGFEDDMTGIPTSALGYIEFAYALQKLAAQFKKEHPNALIVAAGHSLGGAITAKYAMEIPEIVDRVLLLNPMLGLASSWVETVARALPGTLFSKGSKCETERWTSSGGTCQFRLAHVNAMSQFAYAVLCCHWGLQSKCNKMDTLLSFGPFMLPSMIASTFRVNALEARNRRSMCEKVLGFSTGVAVRKKFGEMRGFHVVSTRGEIMVDNQQIKAFASAVRQRRVTRVHGYTSKVKADFCYWPRDLSHSYMSNRKKDGRPEKWWHPYVESVVADFLSSGLQIDIVRVGKRSNDCLVRSQDVAGRALAVLPAIEHPGPAATYWLAGEDIRWVTPVRILFSGDVHKQSSFFGAMHERHIELLRHRTKKLIVTRLKPNDNIRDIFLVGDAPASLSFLKTPPCASCSKDDLEELADRTFCVNLDVYPVRKDRPLRQELDAVHNNGDGRGRLLMQFCGEAFVEKLCAVSACRNDNEGSAHVNYAIQPLN